jgi:2-amino-4-hydroxy-6-hydroxymethyldihydropteridine diphosphokinase/dihydropteroate synthase
MLCCNHDTELKGAAAAAALLKRRAMRDDSELVHLPMSVDTYHARVAEAAVAAGADMVNDVTGGLLDPAMLATVAKLGVPYCLMHMRGDLANMTQVRWG